MTISVSFLSVNTDLGGRSVKAVTFNNALFFPVWDRHLAWSMPYASGIPVTFDLGIEDNQPFYLSATGIGYISVAVTSGGTALYALSSDGQLVYFYNATNTVVASCVPAGQIPTHIAIDSTGLLILAASGNVYHITSISASPTLIGSFGTYANHFSYYNGNIYATLSGTQQLGIMTNPGGAVSTVATPMTYPSRITATSFGTAVTGYSNTVLAYGYSSLQSSPSAPSTVAAGILSSSSAIQVITGTDPTWSVAHSISTGSTPVSFEWVPNDQQVLVSETAGAVQVFNYSSGTLTSAQTLTVTNSGALAITSDSTNALVCQGASNQVGVLVSTLGTWAVGTPTTGITAPTAVVMTTSTGAAVACSGGIALLTRLGNIWNLSSTVALSGFTPSALVYDSVSGNTYAVGNSGGSGYFAYLTAGHVATAVTSWTGSADSILLFSNRIVILDKTNNLIRVFASGPTVFASQMTTTTSPVTSATGISVTNNTIWVQNSSQAVAMQFTAGPQALGIVRTGELSIYNGSSWSNYIFPAAEELATTAAWSTAGNLFVATSVNNFRQFTAAASLTSTTALGEPTGQANNIPLGVSSLVQNGTTWYCVTSLSGLVVIISGVSG
jgi:hypothetical protein